MYIVAPPEFMTTYDYILNRNAMIDEKSKFHTDQMVKIKDDRVALINHLMPPYRYQDAKMLANSLAGSLATIISPDELIDKNGNLGTYYTIETSNTIGFYILSEDLLEDI